MQLPDSVSAVVFDCDGLLVDSEPAWTVGEAAIFAENGFDFGPAQKQLVIGKSISGGCEAMAAYFGRPGGGPQLVDQLLGLVLAELRSGIDPLPGVVALLDALSGRIPLGVASNSNRELLDVSLIGSGLADRFDVTISADDVEHHKPHPQLYLEAFRRLGADPARGVALEDSPTGIASARASGAFVLVVPSAPGGEHDGDFIVSSLDDPTVLEWGRSVQPI
ncbi:MAG TPA: HAD family phosphatase [Galbitalea sp.]|jgi:HAD superfamily hydrolase (TIGR01509 family)|nr:HAD family phosphatase [Galbitalea sp.]